VRYPQAVLVTCEVPWDERFNLLEEAFRREVRAALASGFKHIYVFGTAGEGYAVDTPRFRDIVAVFREETSAPGLTAQVGAIDLSTARIVERIAFAHEQGFRVFQVSLPSWGVLNDVEVLRFFRDVCGTFPDSQFLHYNLPRAKRELTAADYRRVADDIPNLVATKNTGRTIYEVRRLMRVVPEIQHFFGEGQFPVGCLFGECSLLSSFGALFPAQTLEFFEYGRTRQFDRLLPLWTRYLDVIDDFLDATRGKSLIDGAYDKMIARLGGVDMPLRLLSPYESFSEEVLEACRKTLEERHGDWLRARVRPAEQR
jgi:dihydrodipicolinate synthase/N-acetylneuraminate lyase